MAFRKLSVIIPVYNEVRALPMALDALRRECADFEVIVVDGGSTDGTRGIARTFPRVRLIRAAKGRASQMNAGAHIARGEWLLFLHADTRLPDGALARIAALTDDPRCEAGAFRHRFSQRHWLLSLVSAGHNLRCHMTRVFFGDQAIFVRALTFARIGGFPDVPVLEDVMLCDRLRRVTRPVLLDAFVRTDARRFLEFGIVRTTWRALRILVRHRLGLRVDARGFSEHVR